MADYTIIFARAARKELEALEPSLIQRIFSKIVDVAKNPRPQDSQKIRGEKALWRIRIGNYRVIYRIRQEEAVIDILAVRHRREAYR